MLSVFTPLIEHNAWNNSNLEAELEPEIDEAPSWYTDAIVTNEIIIREIMIDPLGDDAGNEFVILWNNDSFPALVGGWRLADGSLSTLYTFPYEYSMMPYIPYVIALGEGEDIESADEEL
ncbi:MAG: hypothetical protein CL969_02290, partial [Euryarchaeota archaeon]|nr:hypothetical protein [Euryarchaeota archaeon]